MVFWCAFRYILLLVVILNISSLYSHLSNHKLSFWNDCLAVSLFVGLALKHVFLFLNHWRIEWPVSLDVKCSCIYRDIMSNQQWQLFYFSVWVCWCVYSSGADFLFLLWFLGSVFISSLSEKNIIITLWEN